MAVRERVRRWTPWVEELAENDYARENITAAAKQLQDAYKRSQKRRVKPARDEKLRRQLSTASASLSEGVRALSEHRDHPKRHWGRWLVLVGGASAAAYAGSKGVFSEKASS